MSYQTMLIANVLTETSDLNQLNQQTILRSKRGFLENQQWCIYMSLSIGLKLWHPPNRRLCMFFLSHSQCISPVTVHKSHMIYNSQQTIAVLVWYWVTQLLRITCTMAVGWTTRTINPECNKSNRTRQILKNNE